MFAVRGHTWKCFSAVFLASVSVGHGRSFGIVVNGGVLVVASLVGVMVVACLSAGVCLVLCPSRRCFWTLCHDLLPGV